MRTLKTVIFSLAVLLLTLPASAQQRSLSGKVVDAAGNGLVGVAVLQQGTSNGVMTGADGSFSITLPAKAAVLEVSSLGYTTAYIDVSAKQETVDNIVLEEDNMLLQETVVVGYGTQKKVNLTGAITTVASEELENRTAHSLTNMLQGSVPGLNISTSQGQPGASGSLNIRGITSINDADPLVLIDGAVGDLDRVNPNDVESVSVIKDAAAAAVYGARAAFGVILVTTKSGKAADGKARIRYSGRFGFEKPTTSTDYETRGYWSVYTVDKFWNATNGNNYTTYTHEDMMELLARVNDKTENPERPWVMVKEVGGKQRYMYYCNTDWYHEMYNDIHPVMNHSISISGGNKAVKYFLSGAYDRQQGIMKANPDIYQKYNLRAKIDAKLNRFMRLSNNSTFYYSTYKYPGLGDVNEGMGYAARHAMASFPLQNPDGTWTYVTDWIRGNYRIANGRHIAYASDNLNQRRRTDFANTTELTITPVKQFNLKANFTYRFYQNRNTHRRNEIDYSATPGVISHYSNTGAYENWMSENIATYNYKAVNVYGTYEDTFKDAHHLTVMAGFNWETNHRKTVYARGYDLITEALSDLDLVSTTEKAPEVSGGQTEYALAGFFGRINYDYKGRYLFEISGRYDGSSRFAKGHRWGFFPSGSVGWRISEEPFFAPARKVVDNLKLRVSYGTLGNQNVANYSYLRLVNFNTFKSYTFGEGSAMARYTNLDAPVSSDLTWEVSKQANVGIDLAMFGNRLQFTAEGYIRDTDGMLTKGKDLPAVYGASSPKMNAADLRTLGYELSLLWKDSFKLAGRPFGYSIRPTLSQFNTKITKFDNPTRILSDLYEGMTYGEIWGYRIDRLFTSDADAAEYTARVNQDLVNARLTGGWMGGDMAFKDLNGNGKIDNGDNTVDNPGDREILGNSLPRLHYGITAAFDWAGIDFSIFFEGTGNHYWYPDNLSTPFWGPFSYGYTTFLQKDFLKQCWSEDNTDAYFPRPRTYIASNSSGELGVVNDRYLQNLRYLRLKNVTVGYTLPKNWTKKIWLEQVRFYFSGENLAYWSPLKKHTLYIDPEAAYTRTTGNTEASSSDDAAVRNQGYYPWPSTFMFGIDITF